MDRRGFLGRLGGLVAGGVGVLLGGGRSEGNTSAVNTPPPAVPEVPFPYYQTTGTGMWTGATGNTLGTATFQGQNIVYNKTL